MSSHTLLEEGSTLYTRLREINLKLWPEVVA